MPRNGSGTYTLPQSAFVPATTISSTAVNSDFSDIATALTGSVSADGQTTITGPLKHSSGTALLPSLTFSAETTTGMYFISASKIGFATAAVAKIVFDGNKTGVGLDGNMIYYFNGAIINPVGSILSYGGSTAPTGWLFCDGSNYIRLNYPELFTVISTTFGSGNGSTTAGLPDLRGRVTVGRDDMGGSAAGRVTNAESGIVGTTLGASGGAQSIILTQATTPAHTHTFSSVTGLENQSITVSVTGGTSGADRSLDHTHTYTDRFTASSNSTAAGGNPPGGNATSTTDTTSTSSGGTLDHLHSISGSGAVTANHNHSYSGTTSSIGSSTSHINMQPSLIVNRIIFAGRP